VATDLYQELGVKRDASPEEIKKAYRSLAAKLHPDRNPGDAKAEARFKTVNRAHQVLGDAKKRRLYDEFGEDGLREGFDAEAARAYRRASGARFRRGGPQNLEDLFGGGGANMGDLFGDLFAGGNGRRAQPKGSDVISEITVDFASALHGTELRLKAPDTGDELTVRIPKGADTGDKLRVPGHGARGRMGGQPGDLLLKIVVLSHPHFERDGIDLYLDLPISVTEAYEGAKVRVPTPDGPVTMTVPAHAQSGQVARLKGKGVQRQKRRGDLYVRFLVRLPDSDTEHVKNAIKTLGEATPTSLRDEIHF
jgi:curved DNA-binding protein